MKKKVKRYQDGGITITPQSNTQELPGLAGYGMATSPYTQNQTSSGGGIVPSSDSGVNQTFNIQPTASAGEPTTMKRGGKVSSASKRADGCAIRGKTRA